MKLLSFLTVLLLTFPNLAASQQASAPAPSSSTQAATLLTQSAAALTGRVALSDVTLSGTARRIAGSDDESGTVVLTATATGSSKLALSFASGNRNEVRSNSSNGPTGSWSGPDGASRPISYHNLMTDSGLFPAFALATLLVSQNTVATYIGQETRNGSSVIHLSAQQQLPNQTAKVATLLQHLSQMNIYLDSTTSLPVSLAYNIHPDNDAGLDIPIEIVFSDYRIVNGIHVPFHIQKFINNSLALDLQFQNVTTNSGLSASSFSL
jgi:hypothetical protein